MVTEKPGRCWPQTVGPWLTRWESPVVGFGLGRKAKYLVSRITIEIVNELKGRLVWARPLQSQGQALRRPRY